MRKRIVQLLKDAGYKAGEKLPSVRAMMDSFSVSSATVQSALEILRNENLIYSIQGKGSFWGSSPMDSLMLPAVRESSENRLSRLFEEDFSRGYFDLEKPLPAMKVLCDHFGTSSLTLRKLLERKVQEGILQRVGRAYVFVHGSKVVDSRLTELLFVTRCNEYGDYAAESEREMDFLRYAYKRAGGARYRLVLLGFNEHKGILLDRNGVEHRIEDFPNAVGAIISTLLVQSPNPMMRLFARVKYPISVWWEQPSSALPDSFLKKSNWFVFNSTFGKYPGVDVGKFLLQRGFTSAIYLSPYHNSSWSRDRLTGLAEAGLKVIEAVESLYASPWDFKQLVRNQVEQYAVGFKARELTKSVLQRLVQEIPDGYWNLPWVCANDEVAVILEELAESQGLNIRGLRLAFDNSQESYLFRLPSFDFNTETLVDQMFFAIENPAAFEKRKLHEIRGKVVEK